MTDPRSPEAATAFARAADELRATEFRDDFVVREIPSPSGLAPQSLALAGDVRPDAHATDSPFGTGRFILLHDPEEPEPWGGAWRVVCFAQAPLEPEIGIDPLLAEVAWSWLIDALDSRGAERHSESGTATKTLSTGFGALAAQGEGSQIELRASWSPRGPFRPHLEAWAELVCMLAGLPPGSEGVAVLGARRPRVAEYTVIEDAAGLAAASESLASGIGPVAVDVERASGFRYSQRAYLIQVFRREAGVFLFDPSTIEDFSPLQQAIGDAEWVFHAASQDLPSLRERGLEPPVIFDTELGARLLGHERVGLGAVVEETLGITLAKAHSAADWSTRPLPPSWLEYAALDVEHLVDVRDKLADELDEQQKTEFARQEFQAVLERLPKPPRDDPWRRLSGLHTVRGRRSLAVARSLWQAREDYAREQDVAPGRLVPDRALVAAVLADPQSKQALAGVKEFNGRASRTQLDRWWNAIVAGREATDLPPDRVPSDTLPPPRAWADRNPEADRRLKAARPAVEARAEELRMPTENLLTPETLRRVAWTPPAEVTAESISSALAELGARPWQIEQTAQVIADSFVASLNADPDESEPTS